MSNTAFSFVGVNGRVSQDFLFQTVLRNQCFLCGIGPCLIQFSSLVTYFFSKHLRLYQQLCLSFCVVDAGDEIWHLWLWHRHNNLCFLHNYFLLAICYLVFWRPGDEHRIFSNSANFWKVWDRWNIGQRSMVEGLMRNKLCQKSLESVPSLLIWAWSVVPNLKIHIWQWHT